MLFRTQEDFNRALRRNHIRSKLKLPNTNNSQRVKNLASLMTYIGNKNTRNSKINNFINTYGKNANFNNKINMLLNKSKQINWTINNGYKTFLNHPSLVSGYANIKRLERYKPIVIGIVGSYKMSMKPENLNIIMKNIKNKKINSVNQYKNIINSKVPPRTFTTKSGRLRKYINNLSPQ